MNQSTNYKHKIEFLLSNSMSLVQPAQTVEPNFVIKNCVECNKRRKVLDSHQVCLVCNKIRMVYNHGPSGNKFIDDFINYTQINVITKNGKLEFVPFEQFIKIEFIAEGGFSTIYKATWIDGPVTNYKRKRGDYRVPNYTVVLKKINDSRNITSGELNEIKIFYESSSKYRCNHYNYVGNYFGITRDPNSQDIMIIMPYYDSGDLIHYITKDFYNISWETKLERLGGIAYGLAQIHKLNIIHRDFHSGNILFNRENDGQFVNITTIGDLGINKSAFESGNDNESYECWYTDPNKRPTADDIHKRVGSIRIHNHKNGIQTRIIRSSDIGPIALNYPGAIYKSRPLSAMINTAMFLRDLRIIMIIMMTVKVLKEKSYMKMKETILKEKLDIDTKLNNEEVEFDINLLARLLSQVVYCR
ncbi:kinase-like domain-containing protein [Rhizophagus irregularis DAOM 181602=DAOM 197198]|nr:kinase-like domain-containing protein [Rhizophagus irregularis DAOM 181602=DAOM 197198]